MVLSVLFARIECPRLAVAEKIGRIQGTRCHQKGKLYFKLGTNGNYTATKTEKNKKALSSL